MSEYSDHAKFLHNRCPYCLCLCADPAALAIHQRFCDADRANVKDLRAAVESKWKSANKLP